MTSELASKIEDVYDLDNENSFWKDSVRIIIQAHNSVVAALGYSWVWKFISVKFKRLKKKLL